MQLVAGGVEPVPQAAPGPCAERVGLLGPGVEQLFGAGECRPAAQRVEPVLFPVEQTGHRPAESLPGGAEQLPFLGQVRHHPLGGIGRGRRPYVGHEVDQWRVGLVADRCHHRGTGGEDRPAQRLVGERQQILDRPTTAGQDDDVDTRVGIEHSQRVDDLCRRTGTLYRDVDHP